MAYLLNKTVFLEDFIEKEGSISFRARANIDEVNNVLSGIYGCEPKFLEREVNYHMYNLECISIRYLTNGVLSAELKSKEKYLSKIKNHIVKLRG
jgi:hypothetical protein